MKTNEIPAIVMLIAGGVYCILGILYQIPLMDFLIQLLIVLLVFWIMGGIVRMVLDHFMGEIGANAKEDKGETEEKDAEGEANESNADISIDDLKAEK